MNGWRIGLPEDPAERDEYRTRGLVGLLLNALAQETRDPEPPAEPASCGALPGDNTGRAFEAEITFSMGLAATEIRSLAADLEQVSAEVTVWPGGQWPFFHVHSDRPGEVVGQIYAYGTPVRPGDHRPALTSARQTGVDHGACPAASACRRRFAGSAP